MKDKIVLVDSFDDNDVDSAMKVFNQKLEEEKNPFSGFDIEESKTAIN